MGARAIVGTHDVRLLLLADTCIDLKAAAEGLHRAQSAVSLGNWTVAWGPSRVALHIGMRKFLAGDEALGLTRFEEYSMTFCFARTSAWLPVVFTSQARISRPLIVRRRPNSARAVARKRVSAFDANLGSTAKYRRGTIDV